jgi:hypothetical protein
MANVPRLNSQSVTSGIAFARRSGVESELNMKTAGSASSPLTDEKIWRYMDFPKFVWLLNSNALWFSRADTFEDKWEALSTALPLPRSKEQNAALAAYALHVRQHKKWRSRLRNQLFITCWSAGAESIPMWKIYGSYDQGIAIQSTTQRFANALRIPSELPSFRSGRVDYYSERPEPLFNYAVRAEFSWDATFKIALQKRACFQFENEWRTIIWAADKIKATGIAIPIIVPELIERIYVSPVATDPFVESVQALLHRYDIKIAVEKSTLADAPSKHLHRSRKRSA